MNINKIISLVILLFGFSFSQGWNSPVTTSLTNNQVQSADNFANKNGTHVLTIGNYYDSPFNNIRYTLLSSSGAIVRSYTFESGGSFPCITGDNSNVYVIYWKNQTIKTWKSTDAGNTWSDDAVDNISITDQYCSGIDAVTDGWGVHMVYSTRPNSSGSWETYYVKNNGSGSSVWGEFKNVTDYNENEVGGFPTVTTSANKVHVSYNTGTGSSPTSNQGNAKTRDYVANSQTWETPQHVYGNSPDLSMVEKIFAVGSELHLFYYKIVGSMGQNHADMNHIKRNVDGTTWSAPTLLDEYAVVGYKIEVAKTSNGVLHVLYPSNGLQYRTFNGSSWSGEQNLSTYSFVQPYTMYSSGNDLFCFWKEDGGINGVFVKYRQYNDVPTAPTGMAIGTSNQVTLNWGWNPEPDVNSYEVWRKYYRSRFDQQDWTLKSTQSSNSWTDSDFQLNSLGNTYTVYYKTRAKDNSNQYSSYSSETSTSAVMVFNKNGSLAGDLAVPEAYSLKQNYPNPFNPSTTISFALPEAGETKLAVYDELGREVANLFEGYLSAGTFEAKFDAVKLSSSMYIYKLTSGKYSEVKRMLLVK